MQPVRVFIKSPVLRQVNLNTAALPAGVDTYTLWVDGRQTSSKQLVVASWFKRIKMSSNREMAHHKKEILFISNWLVNER